MWGEFIESLRNQPNWIDISQKFQTANKQVSTTATQGIITPDRLHQEDASEQCPEDALEGLTGSDFLYKLEVETPVRTTTGASTTQTRVITLNRYNWRVSQHASPPASTSGTGDNASTTQGTTIIPPPNHNTNNPIHLYPIEANELKLKAEKETQLTYGPKGFNKNCYNTQKRSDTPSTAQRTLGVATSSTAKKIMDLTNGIIIKSTEIKN